MRRPNEPTDISKIIANILARKQPARNELIEHAVKVIDETLPSNARGRVTVGKATDKTLTVVVDSNALLSELRAFHHQTILTALRAHPEFSRIQNITYKLGSAHGE